MTSNDDSIDSNSSTPLTLAWSNPEEPIPSPTEPQDMEMALDELLGGGLDLQFLEDMVVVFHPEEEETEPEDSGCSHAAGIVADVEIFNDIFQVAVGDLSYESLNLRMDLMKEEYEETMQAMNKAKDELHKYGVVSVETKVNILDGLVDQTVINVGTADVFGWDFGTAWSEVISSNMTKMNPRDGTVSRRADGKILKGDHFVAPNLEPCVNGNKLEVGDD